MERYSGFILGSGRPIQYVMHHVIIIIIIILFVLKVQKYTTIRAWYKQLTICDNYLKKKKK